jgi:hypothetical protein
MPSILNEALEWLDRAEQAREVAGQLMDPGARRAVLQLAEEFDRLARAAAAPTAARKRELASRAGKGIRDLSCPLLTPTETTTREEDGMGQHRGQLTPEERARITELQDLLIDRFVEQREAAAEGQEERVKSLEAEIDNLLREKREVEKWATVGSA